MTLILYLISGLLELIGVMVGIPSTEQNLLPVGLAVLAVIAVLFVLISRLLKLKVSGVLRGVLAVIILLAIIAVFCGICIIIENATGKAIMQ